MGEAGRWGKAAGGRKDEDGRVQDPQEEPGEGGASERVNAVSVRYQCPWGGAGRWEVVREPGLSMGGAEGAGGRVYGRSLPGVPRRGKVAVGGVNSRDLSASGAVAAFVG